MITDEKVTMLQKLRSSAVFSTSFIRSFDQEWDVVVERLKSSKANLAAITIVAKSVEYKNVRT